MRPFFEAIVALSGIVAAIVRVCDGASS